MTVQTCTFPVRTSGNTDVQDLTPKIQAALAGSELTSGTVTIFVAGSTAGITTVEYEPGLVKDLQEAFERLAPVAQPYHHHDQWHDDNGHSHVRASLLGPSLTVPFSDGRLLLGQWQQIVLVDFDTRGRNREIIVQIMGEAQT